MSPITSDSFESFLANPNNSDLISKNTFGVILVSDDNTTQVHYIGESEFSNYTHTDKPEDIGDLNGTYPWVSLIKE